MSGDARNILLLIIRLSEPIKAFILKQPGVEVELLKIFLSEIS